MWPGRPAAATEPHSVATEGTEELFRPAYELPSSQAVVYPLPLAAVGNQLGLSEDRQMTRDRRLREREVVDDLSHRSVSLIQEPQDLAAGLVGERLEEAIEAPSVLSVEGWRVLHRPHQALERELRA